MNLCLTTTKTLLLFAILYVPVIQQQDVFLPKIYFYFKNYHLGKGNDPSDGDLFLRIPLNF